LLSTDLDALFEREVRVLDGLVWLGRLVSGLGLVG
jgi:hypothetical protein